MRSALEARRSRQWKNRVIVRDRNRDLSDGLVPCTSDLPVALKHRDITRGPERPERNLKGNTMKKIFALATVAAISLAGTASAMTEDEMRALPATQLELLAMWTLEKYGFDQSTQNLTRTQWVAISSADNDSDRSRSEVRSAIQSVLN